MPESLQCIEEFLLHTLPGRIIFGVCSSFFYVLLLILIMRPKIKISPKICYVKDKVSQEYHFIFKVINKTWFFNIYDIEFTLEKLSAETVNSGKKINYRVEKVTLNTDKRHELRKYIPWTLNGDCAFQIRTKESILNMLQNPDVHIVMMVKARHSFSNLTRVVRQEFCNEEIIYKDKEFKYGKYIDVV